MPVRLSSPDRRRQILRAASGLFARRGYRGTTTREIAERAGINEALLFRHFPSKKKLYWTLIEDLCSARERRHNINRIVEAGGSDLETFTAIARELLVRNASDAELTRLLWFTALENHTLSQRFFRTYIAVYYKELAAYIRRRVREGAFRNVDPLLSARGFLGMVVYHFMVQELFGARKFQKFDPQLVAATLAGIWLNGMQDPVRANSNGHNGNHFRAGKRLHHEN
jgi:AcrR family transcriptional regulator